MGNKKLKRAFAKLERLLDGGDAEAGVRPRLDAGRLSDPEYARLNDLLQKAARSGWPSGEHLSPTERDEVRELLGRCLSGPSGTTRFEPWLLPADELTELDGLFRKMQKVRTGSFHLSRLSPEETERFRSLRDRAMVVRAP